MKIVAYDKVTGDFLSTLSGQALESLKASETPLLGYMEVPEETELETSYYKNGLILSRPRKPYKWARWDGENWYNPKTAEQEWKTLRGERDLLLQKSDWTQLPDVPLATKEAWAAYRQALRDVTLQSDPFNIVWPQPPQ